ncbi:redoxin domain-containing protein [Rathayibacter sp. KR2-224]|uniref:redoxin domain-containing protein n=1 Tax=Rathayibacter sp. KR2-224 TaxID=3400913 RepID=UPI003C11E9B0
MTRNPPSPVRRPRRAVLVAASVALAALVAVLLAVAGRGGASQAQDASRDYLRAGMNKPTATLLALDPMRGVGTVKQPEYTLTNEDGSRMTADRFLGKVVVLTFNDDRCADLCALFAQDVIAADHDLSARARAHVAFVSVNANPYFPAPADVEAWSEQHGLTGLPNWYFGTADPATLARTAQAFGVPIQLDPAQHSVQHGTEIFVVGPDGREVDLAQFGAEDADTGPFSHGLALLANDALPSSQRGAVAGSDLPTTVAGGTDVGDTPSPITGSNLNGSQSLSTASDHGHYTVVDFWSSTCTACAQQLPAAEAEHRAVGAAVHFVGVDVDDPTVQARAAASRYGLDFPLIADSKGTDAARFRVDSLPFTVILSPSGKVLVRHPGLFTQEELDYVLREIDTSLPPA